MSDNLQDILARSATYHQHLCPRQVLGVRIGLAGVRALSLAVPRQGKRVLIIAESDGCFSSGIMAATGVSVNKRTLRIEDYGKIAATFIDANGEYAIRVAPQKGIRDRAWDYAKPNETRRYYAMLYGYQSMPEHELVSVEEVTLKHSVSEIMSRAGVRTACDACGEEIINEREVRLNGKVLCLPCAQGGYYISKRSTLTGICQLPG